MNAFKEIVDNGLLLLPGLLHISQKRQVLVQLCAETIHTVSHHQAAEDRALLCSRHSETHVV